MRLLSKSLGQKLLRWCATLALPAAVALSFSTDVYAGNRCDVFVGHFATFAGCTRLEVYNAGFVCSGCICVKRFQSPTTAARAMMLQLQVNCPTLVVAPNSRRQSFVIAAPGAGPLSIRAGVIAACPGPAGGILLGGQTLPQIPNGQTWSNTCVPF